MSSAPALCCGGYMWTAASTFTRERPGVPWRARIPLTKPKSRMVISAAGRAHRAHRSKGRSDMIVKVVHPEDFQSTLFSAEYGPVTMGTWYFATPPSERSYAE